MKKVLNAITVKPQHQQAQLGTLINCIAVMTASRAVINPRSLLNFNKCQETGHNVN